MCDLTTGSTPDPQTSVMEIVRTPLTSRSPPVARSVVHTRIETCDLTTGSTPDAQMSVMEIVRTPQTSPFPPVARSVAGTATATCIHRSAPGTV